MTKSDSLDAAHEELRTRAIARGHRPLVQFRLDEDAFRRLQMAAKARGLSVAAMARLCVAVVTGKPGSAEPSFFDRIQTLEREVAALKKALKTNVEETHE